jgi:hypothetical protein
VPTAPSNKTEMLAILELFRRPPAPTLPIDRVEPPGQN